MQQATQMVVSVALEPAHLRKTAEMDYSDSSDAGGVLAVFDRLIDDLLAGTMGRSRFEKWEIDILLDALTCDLSGFKRAQAILTRYREAVHQQLANGAKTPMKLSGFLASEGSSSIRTRKSKSTSV